MGNNLDTATVIELDGFSLPAATCPMCQARHYPPNGVERCMDRHALLASEHRLQLCRRCHEPKRKSDFTSPRASQCNACREKNPPTKIKPRGTITEVKEYLDDRTYSWGGIG